jgi:hypothetical protein
MRQLRKRSAAPVRDQLHGDSKCGQSRSADLETSRRPRMFRDTERRNLLTNEATRGALTPRAIDEGSTDYANTTRRPTDRRPKTPSNTDSRTRDEAGGDMWENEANITKAATLITTLAEGGQHTNDDGAEETEAMAPTTATPTGGR